MRFAYTDADGNVCIVHAAPKEHLERLFGALTDEQYRTHVLERSIPDGVDAVEIAENAVLPDREFRAAWKLTKGKVVIDQAKKAEIEAQRSAPKPEPVDVQALASRVAALEGRAKT